MATVDDGLKSSNSDVETEEGAPCVKQKGEDDDIKKLIGTILAAASIAAAGYQAYKAYDIAQQEWEMAKKYWDIAKWWLDYYNDYFAPLEDKEIEEALNIEYVEPEYVWARGRTRASAWILYKGKLRERMRCTSRYCTGLRNDMMIQVMRSQADAVALSDGLGYRNERAYVETRNDVLFARKLETAKRGRNLVAEAPSMGKASANIYGDALNQAWQGFEDSTYSLGYFLNHERPAYPQLDMAAAMNGELMEMGGVRYGGRGKYNIETLQGDHISLMDAYLKEGWGRTGEGG